MTPGVENFVKSLNLNGRTLEVGSLDLNGNIRRFFSKYIGLDMIPGKNVDIVARGNYLPFESNIFNNVLCLETLEHDDCFWETILEMKRVLKRGGKLVITVPNFMWAKHAKENDYWRFSEEGVRSLLNGFKEVKIISQQSGATLISKNKIIMSVLHAETFIATGLCWEDIKKYIDYGYFITPLEGIFAHVIKS